MEVPYRHKIQTAISYLVLSVVSGGVAFYAQRLGVGADTTPQLATIIRPIVLFMTILSVLLLGVSVFLFMAAGKQTKRSNK